MADLVTRMADKPLAKILTACANCVRRHVDGVTCEAFPKRIPDVILDGENDHTAPVEGDNGLLFKAKQP